MNSWYAFFYMAFGYTLACFLFGYWYRNAELTACQFVPMPVHRGTNITTILHPGCFKGNAYAYGMNCYTTHFAYVREIGAQDWLFLRTENARMWNLYGVEFEKVNDVWLQNNIWCAHDFLCDCTQVCGQCRVWETLGVCLISQEVKAMFADFEFLTTMLKVCLLVPGLCSLLPPLLGTERHWLQHTWDGTKSIDWPDVSFKDRKKNSNTNITDVLQNVGRSFRWVHIGFGKFSKLAVRVLYSLPDVKFLTDWLRLLLVLLDWFSPLWSPVYDSP